MNLSPKLCDAFVQAKELGRPEIPQIAREHAAKLGIDEVQAEYYLEHVIRHDFGPEEISGLNRFQELAVERGLVPTGGSCVFYGRNDFLESR